MEKSRGIRAVQTREGSPHDSDLADSEAPAKLPVAHRRQAAAAAAVRRPIRPPLFKLSPSRLSRRRDTSQCGSCAAGRNNYCCSVFGKAGGC